MPKRAWSVYAAASRLDDKGAPLIPPIPAHEVKHKNNSSFPDHYPLDDGMTPQESLAFIDSQFVEEPIVEWKPSDKEPANPSTSVPQPGTPAARTMASDRAANIEKMRKALRPFDPNLGIVEPIAGLEQPDYDLDPETAYAVPCLVIDSEGNLWPDTAPNMPHKSTVPGHRNKIDTSLLFLNACVARPVGKKGIADHPKAQKALDAEWQKLVDKKVWNEPGPTSGLTLLERQG